MQVLSICVIVTVHAVIWPLLMNVHAVVKHEGSS